MKNKQLIEAGRNILRSYLHRATPEQVELFKRMYANGKMDLDIDAVIDIMDTDKIDWAIQQCERTEIH